MKRLILAVVCVVLTAAPAYAEHANSGDFFPDGEGEAWGNNITEDYCFIGFQNLGQSEYNNMVNSTVEQVNNEVESQTQIGTNWVSNGNCVQDLDFGEWSCSELRISFPAIQSRVDYENIDNQSPDTRGQTLTCDMNLNGFVDFFWVTIDVEESGYDLHWDVFSTPNPDRWDYAGLFTHEMVHGTGFLGHFTAGGGACTQSVGLYNDMCNNTNLGFHNAGASNGTWWRTLEDHDIGAINEVY